MTAVTTHQTNENGFYGGYNHWDEVSHPIHGKGFVANYGMNSNELLIAFGEEIQVVEFTELKLIKRIPVKVIENNKESYGGIRIGDTVIHQTYGTGFITGYSPFNKDELGVQFKVKIRKNIKHHDLTLVGPTNKMFYKGKLRDLRGLPETY